MKIEKQTLSTDFAVQFAQRMAEIDAKHAAASEARRVQELKDEKDITKPEYWSKLDRLQKRVDMAQKLSVYGGDELFESKRRALTTAAIRAVLEHVKAGE